MCRVVFKMWLNHYFMIKIKKQNYTYMRYRKNNVRQMSQYPTPYWKSVVFGIQSLNSLVWHFYELMRFDVKLSFYKSPQVRYYPHTAGNHLVDILIFHFDNFASHFFKFERCVSNPYFKKNLRVGGLFLFICSYYSSHK